MHISSTSVCFLSRLDCLVTVYCGNNVVHVIRERQLKIQRLTIIRMLKWDKWPQSLNFTDFDTFLYPPSIRAANLEIINRKCLNVPIRNIQITTTCEIMFYATNWKWIAKNLIVFALQCRLYRRDCSARLRELPERCWRAMLVNGSTVGFGRI